MSVLRLHAGAMTVAAVALVLGLAGCADDASSTLSPSGTASTPAAGASASSPTDPSTTTASPGGAGATPVVPDLLDFVAQDTDGREVEGADLAGKDVVLWFWAPWCTVCARAADEVRSVAADRADVRFVGVGGLSSDPSALDRFIAQNDIGDLVHVADVDGEVYTRFGISQQHSFVVLHADGEVETVPAYGTSVRLDELVTDAFG